MKQFFGMSHTGYLKDAIKGVTNPKLIVLMSNEKQFEQHVKELEEFFPNVPSIGGVGHCYGTSVVENGVGIIVFSGDIEVATNLLEETMTMPIKYIARLKEDIKRIRGTERDTVCIDFCTGNDACVLTSVHSVLKHKKIGLVGGTSHINKVSVNGKVYENAMVYALVRNLKGKVKVYKENIYRPLKEHQFIASKTDRTHYKVGALNNKPASQVYQDILGITEKQILTQTFKNPFGRLNGDDICIISIKDVQNKALICYRQVNNSDILLLLELADYKQVVHHTIEQIEHDFSKISAVFSVNCLFRYLLFQKENYIQQYFKDMSRLNGHAGFIGDGEHYHSQFVNQSMTCVVFE